MALPNLTTRAGLARHYGLDARSHKLNGILVVARLSLGDGQIIDLYHAPAVSTDINGPNGIRCGYGINPSAAAWAKHLKGGK
jgi:hypothetical protein